MEENAWNSLNGRENTNLTVKVVISKNHNQFILTEVMYLFRFVEITCGYPGFTRNSYIIGRSYFYQDKVVYRCYDGYDLVGSSTRICREDGRWFPEKPICKGAQCIAFKKPEHSQISIIAEYSYEDFQESVSHFDIGTQIEVNCDKNAHLNGEKVITCQENGKKAIVFFFSVCENLNGKLFKALGISSHQTAFWLKRKRTRTSYHVLSSKYPAPLQMATYYWTRWML